jgi:hypothetical protein
MKAERGFESNYGRIKSQVTLTQFSNQYSLNRTMVGLKDRFCHLLILQSHSLNRTMVGL